MPIFFRFQEVDARKRNLEKSRRSLSPSTSEIPPSSPPPPISQYHTIIRAAFVCVFVPYLLRGPLTDLRQTWWLYVGGPPNCT